MPLQQTSGNVTADAYGGGVAAVPNYIEDVFSTYLYTGNGSTQTITNGIDLSGKGGLVWIKSRNWANIHCLFNTTIGATKYLQSNSTTSQNTYATTLTSFNSDGFSLGASANVNRGTTYTFASWSFRKQPKFFDVVTYTGNGAARNISHNLGSVPGCIIIKSTTDAGSSWAVYHRSLALTDYLWLESTNASTTNTNYWNNTAPTSTAFSVGTDGNVNLNGATYVAYLFAHNAGGFGLTGTDNVISCGSFAGGTNVSVTLGWEPQWLLVKRATGSVQNWFLMDNMRGLNAAQGDLALSPNLSNAEPTASSNFNINATGFVNAGLGSGTDTYIYIAIRRGPMKVPTDGTKVFAPVTATGTGSVVNITTGFPVDFVLDSNRTGTVNTEVMDRLRGGSQYSVTQSTAAEGSFSYVAYFDRMTSYGNNNWGASAGSSIIDYCFRRAPGFFDEVCYTGTGSLTAYNHNLGVVPELVIVKSRSTTYDWYVIQQPAGGGTGPELLLNTSGASLGSVNWSSIANATTFTPYSFYGTPTGASGQTYVAYLFASCPGVSKVGSYTGNGTTQTINCGFTGGARFVLIKRTDASGDWYVYDTARGMTTLTDPYLLLNSTAAESATLGSVTTVTTGFAVNASILAAINTNGASYIFLAIA